MASIRVVYPRPEQAVYDDSTFVMGMVAGAAGQTRLKINGQAVPLSRKGFFSHPVHLKVGANTVRLEVLPPKASKPLAQASLTLHRAYPYKVLPAAPLAVHAEILTPLHDRWLSPGDTLVVAGSMSVNAKAEVSIAGLLEKPVRLQPLAGNNQEFLDTRTVIFAQPHWTSRRIPVKGYQQAVIAASALFQRKKKAMDLPITLTLSHSNKARSQTLKKTLPGKVTLLEAPRTALLIKDAVSRTAPVDAARLTPQKHGTRFYIDGLEEGWARARLNPDEAMYLPLAALQFHPGVPGGKPFFLESIRTEGNGTDASRVHLAFNGSQAAACPVQIEADPGINRLRVRLYDVCSRCDFIHYPPADRLIRQIHWRQVAENTLEVWIDLARPLIGYDYAFQDGEWVISVKSLPETIRKTRILIDPGHGGAETGSTGLDGTPEKALNLSVSKMLHAALKAEGFRVAMTRQSDTAVSLEARARKAKEYEADLILSIHHNALPDGRDPREHRGACTFYYHPFSRQLAERLLAGLTENRPDLPNYGLFYDSLAMTRIHQGLAVLIELGFFTHPQEYENLINPAFQRESVHRLVQAIKAYLISK